MEGITHEFHGITLPKPGPRKYPKKEGLPNWDMDLHTDWKGRVPREPLRVHKGIHDVDPFVYTHGTYPKNDGLFLPNLYAGLREKFDWNSLKMTVHLGWHRRDQRLVAYINQCRDRTKKPAFLLHFVVQVGRSCWGGDWPLEGVQEVFRACPEAIALGDIHLEPGYLPLHFACKRLWEGSNRVIRFLLNMYPQAAQNCLNENEELPIHILLRNHQYRADLVRPLVEAFPDSLKRADKQGDLPIHILLGSGECGSTCLRFLVEAFPDSLQKENKQGDLPLHVAIRRNHSFANLQYLVEKSPQALRHPNSPLHLAIMTIPIGTVFPWIIPEMIQLYPQALTDPDKGETRALLQTNYPQISEAVVEFVNYYERVEWLTANGNNICELVGPPPPSQQQQQQESSSGNHHEYHKCIHPLQAWASFQLDRLEEQASEVAVAMEQNMVQLEALERDIMSDDEFDSDSD